MESVVVYLVRSLDFACYGRGWGHPREAEAAAAKLTSLPRLPFVVAARMAPAEPADAQAWTLAFRRLRDETLSLPHWCYLRREDYIHTERCWGRWMTWHTSRLVSQREYRFLFSRQTVLRKIRQRRQVPTHVRLEPVCFAQEDCGPGRIPEAPYFFPGMELGLFRTACARCGADLGDAGSLLPRVASVWEVRENRGTDNWRGRPLVREELKPVCGPACRAALEQEARRRFQAELAYHALLAEPGRDQEPELCAASRRFLAGRAG